LSQFADSSMHALLERHHWQLGCSVHGPHALKAPQPPLIDEASGPPLETPLSPPPVIARQRDAAAAPLLQRSSQLNDAKQLSAAWLTVESCRTHWSIAARRSSSVGMTPVKPGQLQFRCCPQTDCGVGAAQAVASNATMEEKRATLVRGCLRMRISVRCGETEASASRSDSAHRNIACHEGDACMKFAFVRGDSHPATRASVDARFGHARAEALAATMARTSSVSASAAS
jgi:hypothetical protein